MPRTCARHVRDDLVAPRRGHPRARARRQMPGANAEAKAAYASRGRGLRPRQPHLESARTPRDFKPAARGARGGPLRDAVGARGPGRPHAAGAPRAVLLRPAPRPVLARGLVVPAGRDAAGRPGLRGRRPARRPRRAAADPLRRARRRPRPVLRGRPGLRAVLLRLLPGPAARLDGRRRLGQPDARRTTAAAAAGAAAAISAAGAAGDFGGGGGGGGDFGGGSF